MSQLDALKATTTLSEVALLLDIKPGMLSHELYKKPKATLYSKFSIPKRYGGSREILAPNKDLKLIQHRLALLLEGCMVEINKSLGHPENEHHPGVAHGFKRKHSIITNARPHITRRNVFNVDLKDFFGTINFGRVRGYFISNRHFSLNPDVATVLAQIACHENQLPQGSPCSPIISNLIGHTLDMLLVRLAKASGCTYTRYADDLTFSSNKPLFSSRVAFQPNPHLHQWEPGHGLKRLIAKSGFSINPNKTRMQYRDSNQSVTGLTVNRKVNVPASYRNRVRAMAHALFTTGKFDLIGEQPDGAGGTVIRKTPGKVSQLIGMLAYIDHIDQTNHKIREQNNLEPTPTPGRIKLFRRTLYFDYFYSPESPVIICEGKTDNTYINCALKRLASVYPTMATSGTPAKLKVRLFKYTDRRTHEITEINGGVGGLCKLIKYYHDDTTNIFKAPPPKHPIIVLIDNDAGSNKVYGAIAGITGKHKPTGMERFIHVTSNLYVVPTPLGVGGAQTMIEDFFDAGTRAKELSGKKFDPGRDADNRTHYSKAAFARDVVAKNAGSIDFSRFSEIFDRMAEVISDYSGKLSPTIL